MPNDLYATEEEPVTVFSWRFDGPSDSEVKWKAIRNSAVFDSSLMSTSHTFGVISNEESVELLSLQIIEKKKPAFLSWLIRSSHKSKKLVLLSLARSKKSKKSREIRRLHELSSEDSSYDQGS